MEVAEALERLEDEGFVVLESLISATRAAELDALARRAVADCPATAEGTASWEGGYSSLEGAINRMPELAELVDHPLLLEIAAGALKTEAFEQYNGVGSSGAGLAPELALSTPIGRRTRHSRPGRRRARCCRASGA